MAFVQRLNFLEKLEEPRGFGDVGANLREFGQDLTLADNVLATGRDISLYTSSWRSACNLSTVSPRPPPL